MLWARSWPGVVTACCMLRRVPLCVAAQRVVCCAPAVRCTNVAPFLHAARPTPRADTACCNALRRTLRAVAGLELTRVTVVDANGAALLNELVLPHDPILDYNTRCVSRTPRSLGVPVEYPRGTRAHAYNSRVRCGQCCKGTIVGYSRGTPGVLQGYSSPPWVRLSRSPLCGLARIRPGPTRAESVRL
jgi:hypothetical protein